MEEWITEPQTAVARIVENVTVFLMYGEVIVVASYGCGKVAALIGVNVKGFAVKPQVCRQIVKIGIFGDCFCNGIGVVRYRIRFIGLRISASASCHQHCEQKKKGYIAFHIGYPLF